MIRNVLLIWLAVCVAFVVLWPLIMRDARRFERDLEQRAAAREHARQGRYSRLNERL